MRKLSLSVLFLACSFLASGQATVIPPTTLIKAGAVNTVLNTNASGFVDWVAPSTLQGAFNYWVLSGGNVSRVGGNVFIADGTKFGVSGDATTHFLMHQSASPYHDVFNYNEGFRFDAYNGGTPLAVMTLLGNGNVGIGGTPTYNLDVVGISRTKRTSMNGAGTAIVNILETDQSTIGDGIALAFAANTKTYGTITAEIKNSGASYEGDLVFRNATAGTVTEKMRISGSGSVGILSNLSGVANPTIKISAYGIEYAAHGLGDNFDYFINAPYGGSYGGGLRLKTQGADRLIVTKSTGNVLINENFDDGSKLNVNGTIQAGANAATAGTVLLRAKYDGNNAQNFITEYSTGAIGISAFMYQEGSAAWKSGYNYGANNKTAILLRGDGLVFLAAPSENVAAGVALPTQPSNVFSISNQGWVGIARVGASYPLDIEGDFRATGRFIGNMKLTSGSWNYIGGFGGNSYSATKNWNDSDIARSGSASELMNGGNPNGTGHSEYYHAFGYEYITRDGSGNLTQIAYPYNLEAGSAIMMRTRWDGTWGAWTKQLCENINGHVLVGTRTDNGVDKLQVTGSAKISSTLRLGSSTVGIIESGSGGAQFTIWNKGTVQFPITTSSDPTGLGNGDVWANLTSGDHKLKFRANDITQSIASVEVDFAGLGSWAASGASSITLDNSNRNLFCDANANAVTLVGGTSMKEGVPFRIKCRRNAINAITLSASGMGGTIEYSTGTTIPGPSTLVLDAYGNYEITRIGSVLFVKKG